MSLVKLILLSLMMSGAAKAADPRPEIAFRRGTVEVTAGVPVRLADVASVSFASNEAGEKADALVLFEPLADQQNFEMTNAEVVRLVKSKLAAQSEVAQLNWTFFVPEKIVLTGRKNLLSANRLNAAILHELARRCADCKFKLEDTKLPQIRESAALTDYGVDVQTVSLTGGFLLPVQVRFGDQKKTFYYTGRVETRARALVAQRGFQLGDTLKSADFREDFAVLPLGSDAFLRAEELNGKLAARPIQVGRALTKQDAKNEIAVQRGQLIRAISGSELFEVSTQMLAEESGAVGDVVKLRNPETQKMLSGKIVERGLARIQ